MAEEERGPILLEYDGEKLVRAWLPVDHKPDAEENQASKAGNPCSPGLVVCPALPNCCCWFNPITKRYHVVYCT